MFGHNIGSISTSNLSIPGVFNVSKFSYNLFFFGPYFLNLILKHTFLIFAQLVVP